MTPTHSFLGVEDTIPVAGHPEHSGTHTLAPHTTPYTSHTDRRVHRQTHKPVGLPSCCAISSVFRAPSNTSFRLFSVAMCPNEVSLIHLQLEELTAKGVTCPQSHGQSVSYGAETRTRLLPSQSPSIALSKGKEALKHATGQTLTVRPAKCSGAKHKPPHRTNISEAHSAVVMQQRKRRPLRNLI